MKPEDLFHGKAKVALEKISEILEVDSIQPIWPIMISTFRAVLVEFARDENYRLISLVNPISKEYIAVADIEELRVLAKKLEVEDED